MTFSMQHWHSPGYLREICIEIHHAGHSLWQGNDLVAIVHLEKAQQLIDDWIESLREDLRQ